MHPSRGPEHRAHEPARARRADRDQRLYHGFDLARLRRILADYGDRDTLVLVGHEPSMSAVISALIGGGDIELKKGGVASVLVTNRAKPKGKLQFLVTPAVLACE